MAFLPSFILSISLWLGGRGGGAASILLGTAGTGCGSASTEIIINYLF
jgi:hypothetical protein